MDLPFDTKQTDKELALIREREEEDLASILAEKYGMAYADLSLKEIDTDALRVIPEKEAREAGTIAFAKVAKTLSIAISNPNNPALAKLREDIAQWGFKTKEFLVSKKSLEKALARYADLSYAVESRAGVFTIPPALLAKLAQTTETRATLEAELGAASALKSLDRVSHILEVILTGAFALRASDIHFEPSEQAVRLRVRIDGVLVDTYSFDPPTYHQLNSRIKLLSGVKLNITNRAQDGRFSVARMEAPTSGVGVPTESVGSEVEMRVSFIPGNFGESIVLRILDPKATLVSYKEL